MAEGKICSGSYINNWIMELKLYVARNIFVREKHTIGSKSTTKFHQTLRDTQSSPGRVFMNKSFKLISLRHMDLWSWSQFIICPKLRMLGDETAFQILTPSNYHKLWVNVVIISNICCFIFSSCVKLCVLTHLHSLSPHHLPEWLDEPDRKSYRRSKQEDISCKRHKINIELCKFDRQRWIKELCNTVGGKKINPDEIRDLDSRSVYPFIISAAFSVSCTLARQVSCV